MKFPKLYYQTLQQELNFLNSNRHSFLGNKEQEQQSYFIKELCKELQKVKQEYVLPDENTK